MDLEKLRQKLLKSAREIPVSGQVPYAFEKRVMASLAGRKAVDPGAWWARGLWRAAAVCVAVSLLLGFWSFTSAGETGVVTLERTFFSVAEQLSSNW